MTTPEGRSRPPHRTPKERRTLPRVKPLAMAWRGSRNPRFTSGIYAIGRSWGRARPVPGIACDRRVVFRIPCARHGEGGPHQSGDGGDRFVGAGCPRRRRGAFRGAAGGSGRWSPRGASQVWRFLRCTSEDRGGPQPAHRRTGRHPQGARRALPSGAESPQHSVASGSRPGFPERSGDGAPPFGGFRV